jgi:peptide/nickel transport system substrate-binding protein
VRAARRFKSWGRGTTARLSALWLILTLVVSGCAAPPRQPPSAAGGAAPPPAIPKRITVAIIGEAQTLYVDVTVPGGGAPGDNAIQELVNTGLTEMDDAGISRPQLAMDVPSLENGLWRLFEDGTMETTWQIKPNARWHDGVPYTADDLLFTFEVLQDRDLPLKRFAALSLIERLDAPDPHTLVARWAKPFIEADTLFSRELALPLPSHLLGRAAAADKASFNALPYWSDEFVGTGPFKLRSLSRGAYLLLAANEAYALGRPRIDELEVKFLPDPNALIANVLAGEVDVFLGRGMNFERAMVVRDQWRDGRLETRLSGLIVIYAQFLQPNPAVVTDLQFRRGLLHAVDRQQLVDALLPGQGLVSHVFLGPYEPAYKDVESRLVRYDYDPGRAAQLLEGLGYTRGPDGALRDAGGQRLVVEMRSEPLETEQKSLFAVTDFWSKLGIGVEPLVIPQQRTNDLEYRYTFPGLYLRGHASSVRTLVTNYHGSQSPLTSNRWSGSNRGRYVNAELDGLLDQYLSTIPMAARMAVLGKALTHLTEQLPVLTLFYNTEFTLMGNRTRNVVATKVSSGAAKTWNSHQWDTQ